MKRLKVVVLMGGKSSEHEVSILSGKNVVSNLDAKKYDVLPVVVSKDGVKWRLTTKDSLLSIPDPLRLKGTSGEITLPEEKSLQGTNSLVDNNVNVVFIAMHGPFGENGTIQGMLELTGIPYTGSGVTASAIGMNKIMFRKVMAAEGIPIPKYVVFEKGDSPEKIFGKLGKPPYFIKPSSQGSSVGASIAKKRSDLRKSLNLALKYDDGVLVDEYIKGLEVTCTVLGNNKPIILPVIEIVPLKGEFFDYESKYTESGSNEIVPARISESLTRKVQEISLKVYKTLGCRGFARVDFILKNGRMPVVLEINTIPGLTEASLVPKAAKAAGMSYPDFLDRIIKYAIEKS